jgi:hypothetical protein
LVPEHCGKNAVGLVARLQDKTAIQKEEEMEGASNEKTGGEKTAPVVG